MLESAIATAAKAHEGQTDKAGKPYILHPLRVMLNVKGCIPEQCAAVLHDVIEDTDITAEALLELGFCSSHKKQGRGLHGICKKTKSQSHCQSRKACGPGRQHGYVQNTEPDRKGLRPS